MSADFSNWIKKVFGSSFDVPAATIADNLGPPIEDYLPCDTNCECPKVPDKNGIMRNHEAEYAAGLSAGRWIREQQIVRALRNRATVLSGDAKLQMLLFAEDIEGGGT
jgi:hypothetical protein